MTMHLICVILPLETALLLCVRWRWQWQGGIGVSKEDIIYGKLKNKRLIKAPSFYMRDGNVGFNDCSLYESLGYKEVIYHDPPKNQNGYELCCSWNEEKNSIEQNWFFRNMEEDYSSELLCSIRDFNWSLDFIIDSIHKLRQEHLDEFHKMLKENYILKLIWEKRCLLKNEDTLLDLMHRCDLDLQVFFEKLSITVDLEKMGFTIYPLYLELKEAEQEPRVFPFTYIKSGLDRLYSLYNFSTLKSKSAYDMAYIYAFTLFDDLLLKFARYICTLDRRWLASNTTLSFKDIVDCSSLEEVHQLLIEQKITELSWGSYLDKLAFFKKHGVDTGSVDSILFDDTVAFISEKRNAIVHNGGRWNTSIRDKLRSSKQVEAIVPDEPVDRSVESIEKECGDNLRRAANNLYDLLCSKFNLIHRYKVEVVETDEQKFRR